LCVPQHAGRRAFRHCRDEPDRPQSRRGFADAARAQLHDVAPDHPAAVAAGDHRLADLCLRPGDDQRQRDHLSGLGRVQHGDGLYRRPRRGRRIRPGDRLFLDADPDHAGRGGADPAAGRRASPRASSNGTRGRPSRAPRGGLMASGAKQPTAVELQSVTKRYGATTAVNNVSFTVEAGTLATLLGPSGCGKTTTLRLIAGLEQVSQGRILIGGRDMTRLPATERDVSMVFQSYALFPHMTALENVAYGPLVSGVRKARARALAAETLALLGLSGLD